MTGRRAFIDANVFVMNWTTDVLLTLADWKLVAPFWSDKVMEEAGEAIRRVKGIDPTRYIEAIRGAFERSEVPVEDSDLAGIELPDPDDRHVVAGAQLAGCEVIVTYNLKDFPAERLAGAGVVAVHPDEFLMGVARSEPEMAYAAVKVLTASKGRPPRTMEAEIGGLRARGLASFAAFLEDKLAEERGEA